MKAIFKLPSVLLILCLSAVTASAQPQFTSYDDLPGLNKSYKPAYSEDFPRWAKMLYTTTVNFNDISREFEAYMKKHKGEENAIIRYFKIWSRAVESYVLADGAIVLPDMDLYFRKLRETQTGAGLQVRSRNTSNADWTFLGPKETFWLNESGSAPPRPLVPGRPMFILSMWRLPLTTSSIAEQKPVLSIKPPIRG